jgi:hypothetical protein
MSLNLPYITDFNIIPKGQIGLKKYLLSVLRNLPENWEYLPKEIYDDTKTFHILNSTFCIEAVHGFEDKGIPHKAKLYIGLKDDRAFLLEIKFKENLEVKDEMNNINFMLYWFHYFILKKNKYYKQFNHKFELGGPQDENWNHPDIRDSRSENIVFKKDRKTMNFSKGLKAKIGKQDIIYFMPNNIALSLSLTKKSFKKAFSIHKNLVSKSQSKTIKLELKDKSELFDYFEEIISCVTFAFISVEAMANSAIPEEFSREITNSKKIKEIWTKENIERWMSTSQKISTILPEIFDCGDVKQENFWNKFTELEKARNDIVHQKTINQGTAMDDNLFSLLLEPSIFDKIKSAFSVIEHFYKLENSHPYFPLGMGIAKMNFKEADSFDDYTKNLKEIN